MSVPYDCDALISAEYIVCQDTERRIIERGALAVADGRIVAIGAESELDGLAPKERIRLGSSLVMPGLVNAHTHVSMTFLRGLADDLPLMEWLTQHIFPKEQHLTAEIVELGALLGCAEMTRTGTTAFADMYLFENGVARAVEAAGLRCLMGEAVFAFPTPAAASPEAAYEAIRALAADCAQKSRLRAAIMPHTVYTTTPKILTECAALAHELDLPVQIHLSETATEVADCLATYGKRPVAHVKEMGLLGPRSSLAHCVVLDDHEMDELAAFGAHVVHNPRSNMKLASGVAPVPGMRKRGMLPALGTDGAASNNGLNMFAEMSACALLHKVHGMDPTLCPAQDVLDMATLGGAAALDWPELGALVVGGPADLVALDLASPNFLPVYNPVSHLIYSATGHEVRLSMVEGRVLYKDGDYLALDIDVLLREAAKLKRWVLAKI